MEGYLENWNKKDLQVAILQAILVAFALHYGIKYLLPDVMKKISGYRSSNVALADVQKLKSSREVSIASLEEEAERLRVEIVEKSKTVASKPTQQIIPDENRYRMKTPHDPAAITPTIQSEEANKGQTVVRSAAQSANPGKNFRLNDHVVSPVQETSSPSPKEEPAISKSKIKFRSRPAIATSSTTSATQSTTSAPFYPNYNSLPTYNIKDYEDERQTTLSEQDLAYEMSLRADRTHKLMLEERAAVFQRIVFAYTELEEEPDISDPTAITVIFKISDEVYNRGTNMTKIGAGLKHKRISHRFHPSDKVQSLFSFIFCHLYQFPDHEEKYLGGPNFPALFTPCLHGSDGDDVASLEESSDFISFDLICSYPKVVLNSAALFFNPILDDDDTPPQTILDLGIKNNTLLSLRPTDLDN